MGREEDAGRGSGPRGARLALAALCVALLGPGAAAHGAEVPAEDGDSCTACHGDPSFLVTNKKLYDYFQQWEGSIHQLEGVTCQKCHGGNPKAKKKEKAHGAGVAASDPSSGIYYKKIPQTCGSCHEDILEGFQQSNHYEHLDPKEADAQGPTCATCHGSINAEILNVNSVRAACSHCHNEETENNPEIPEEATAVLNKFLSIQRFYRYITIKAEPEEAKAFFSDLDPRLRRLSVTWHTFDLEEIEKGVADVLGRLKAKRDELRQRRAEAR
jgi:hypothetical protein